MRTIRTASALITAATIAVISAVATAQSSDPSSTIIAPPSEFTAHSECGPYVGNERIERVTGQTEDGDPVVRTERRGDSWHIIWEASDPRLQGTLTLSSSEDSYAVEGASGGPTAISREAIRIENANGAWEDTLLAFTSGDEASDDQMRLLTGEGDYEGLSALMYQITPPEEASSTCASDHRGIVFEQAPPIEA
jgi:hypothetical protein